MVWNAILALALSGGLTLGAEAGAETYSLLAGSVTDGSTGETTALSGSFQADLFVPEESPEPPAQPEPDVLLVDDFALRAGARSFTPALPVMFDGLEPLFLLQIADQVHVDGENLGLVLLRSGGEVVGLREDEVTFRFTEFRGATSGRAAGDIGTGLPRQLQIEGTLHEVDRSFTIRRDEPCFLFPPPVLPPAPGGGGITIGGGGDVEIVDAGIVGYETFDIAAGGTVDFAAPAGAGALGRVAGERPSSIGGDLQADGEVFLVNPAGIDLGSPATVAAGAVVVALAGAAPPVPSLEELGITAPDGAEVTFDADGALTVSTVGDLFIEGDFLEILEIPGLTSLTLDAGGDVIITGDVAFPADIVININAGGAVDIGGGVPGPVEPPLIGVPLCNDLVPLRRDERLLGTWSLLATAATPVEIDVQPRRVRNRVLPGSRRLIEVALLGSDQLDVRDVDPRSLRLGFGEAEPRSHRGRVRYTRRDVNRDRRKDLLAQFEVRDAGIAFGDTRLCLLAEADGGVLLEGCDAIDTVPERARRRHRARGKWIGPAVRRPTH